jgi:ACS family hexuronate transporter-like MFS transporter
MYDKPERHKRVSAGELEYIQQDDIADAKIVGYVPETSTKVSFAECFKYKQTWAFAFGKFMTDGVWWFFLFWTPAYLSSVYGMDSTQAALPLFVLYMITLLSIIGGWLPTYFVEKKGMNPYEGRMRAMLIFAFFPLLALVAQPLGYISYWVPVVIIGIAGAAHQSWSANIFTTVGDMFPKKAIATITGIGGLAGGLGSTIINKGSGLLFDFTQTNWSLVNGQPLLTKYPQFQNPETAKVFLNEKGVANLGDFLKLLSTSGDNVVNGINSGYMIIFSICAVCYLIGWAVMKTLVPKYSPITNL